MKKAEVILTREQAAALEALKEVWSDVDKKDRNRVLIREKLTGEQWEPDKLRAANEIPDGDFIEALTCGYEVWSKYKDFYDFAEQLEKEARSISRRTSVFGDDYPRGSQALIRAAQRLRELIKRKEEEEANE